MSIGESTFNGCSSLTSITIPESVTSIGGNAFNSCSSLTSITIPKSVTSIGYGVFRDCFSLTSIIVEKGNTQYDSRNNCNAIIETGTNTLIVGCKNTTIPNSVYSIKGAFYGCTGLVTITIPNSVTNIGYEAFYGCSGLTSITIPNSVTSIGGFAFSGCSNLTSINIPNSVTSIGGYTFDGCLGLTSITIPKSVTNIGNYTFNGCSGIKSLTSEASTPPNCDVYCFNGIDKSTPVYVPFNSIEAYKVAAEWKDFTNIQAIINSETYTVTLDHNKGVGDPEQITVTYNQPMPENIGLVVPTRTGYVFNGYSSNGIFYYDANLKSVRNFDKKQDYTLYADWKARTTIVTLNPQGGQNGTSKVTATYGKAMPTGENIVAPTRAGYTFEGYYSSANGKGTQYYNADMTSKRSWNKDASSTTLYAYWKAIAVSSISLSEKNVTLCVADTKTITAFVTPTTAYNKDVIWSSSDSNVATVDENGVVTGVGAGTAIIKATAADGKGAYAECKVTVVYNSVTLIDASENYSNETEAMVITLKYIRTFNNTAWQALYIPFSMSYDDWKDDFEVAYINGVRQLDKNDDGIIDETIMDVIKIKSGSTSPNMPYLIKAKTTGEKTFSVSNASLYPAEENSIDCSTTIAKYTFTGTYNAIPSATMIANGYYAMGGGDLIQSDGSNNLKPYRWYMKVESRNPSYNASNAAKTITINVIDEEGETTTGVNELRMTNYESPVYDLNGRKVNENNLKPGIYVKNGKKFALK